MNESLQQALIPPGLAAAAGGAYGAYQAPGNSRLRGGLIGGLAGLGAGAGLTGVNSFLDSGYARHIKESPGIAASLLLGGTGLGAMAGLHGGRTLTEMLGLGNPRDKVDNDLAELSPVRMLPQSLRHYLRR